MAGGSGAARASRSLMAGGSFSEAKVIAAKVKTKTSKSELCKFLGIPERSRSPTALLISKFIGLYNHQSPGIKDRNWDENLKTLLHGKSRVGVAEITRLLSQEFTYSRIKSTATSSATPTHLADQKLQDSNKSKKTKGKASKNK
ncbi:hypothetical protein ACFX13_043075 [Malus domestica]|uniref:DM2 domain-containing protein n=1 Tax=Malus domestica TaxID=3750 RepID=A0A498JB32_MALDO|nr:uncharacterized protein LOC126633533 [Malus sylvestris]RXH91002.1 hypothetical protein DVH24_020025 [Malus domestica]